MSQQPEPQVANNSIELSDELTLVIAEALCRHEAEMSSRKFEGFWKLHAGNFRLKARAVLHALYPLAKGKDQAITTADAEARVRKVEDGGHEFTTGDDDPDLLLGLTTDIADDGANMDTGVWWLQTLETVKARLAPQPQAAAASSLCCDGKSERNEFCCGLPPTSPATAVDAVAALQALYDAVDSCVELTPEVMQQARAALQASRQPVTQQGGQ